jgi:hypothetical protein
MMAVDLANEPKAIKRKRYLESVEICVPNNRRAKDNGIISTQQPPMTVKNVTEEGSKVKKRPSPFMMNHLAQNQAKESVRGSPFRTKGLPVRVPRDNSKLVELKPRGTADGGKSTKV